jgi:hypothetical protein
VFSASSFHKASPSASSGQIKWILALYFFVAGGVEN